MPGYSVTGGGTTAPAPSGVTYGPPPLTPDQQAEAAQQKQHDEAAFGVGADADTRPSFAGYTQGANDAANNYAANAAGWANHQAPSVDMSDAGAARGYGASALGLDLATAQGAPTAADAQLQQNIGAAQAGQASLAAGARGGGANIAAAQRGGVMQQAAIAGQGGQDASILRAQQMAQARAQLGQQAVGQQQADMQQQAGLAGLQQSQEQINQQGQLGFYGLANQTEGGQLTADTAHYAGLLGLQGVQDNINAQNNAYLIGGTSGAVGGLMTGLSQGKGS